MEAPNLLNNVLSVDETAALNDLKEALDELMQ